jgi:uncharacterized protein (TIGR02001 family)
MMAIKRAVLIVAAVVLAARPALAEEEKQKGDWIPGEFSGNVSVNSDYVFRGISQTDHKAALQGGIDYTVETGILGTSFYAGLWGSNVDFGDGDKATAELDWSFGLSGDIGDTGVGWSLGGLYYQYPDANKSGGNHLNYDYWEIPVALSYAPHEWVSLGAGYNYSPDFFAGSGDGHYVNGTVSFAPPVPWFGLSFDAGVGYQWIEKNAVFGADDYLDWTIGATINVKGVDFGIHYTDTNLSKSKCFGGTNLCEPRIVVSVGLSGPLSTDDKENEKGQWLPGEFSGGVAAATDYVFRGISQTNHKPALQGNIDYTIATGILGTSVYADVWGSNVDFQDGDEATVELDGSFGLTGDIADTGVTWSLGGLYYAYPGADKQGGQHLNYDFWEIPVALGYGPHEWVSLGVGYNYSPDFFGGSGDGHYVSGTVSFAPPVPWFDLSIDAGIGHQWIESNSTFGADDYLDWKIGATVTVKGIDLGIAYTDTNLSKRKCFGGSDLCEARVVASVGMSF